VSERSERALRKTSQRAKRAANEASSKRSELENATSVGVAGSGSQVLRKTKILAMDLAKCRRLHPLLN